MTKLSTCRIVFCTMVVMRRDSRVGCDVLRVNWGGGSAITLNSYNLDCCNLNVTYKGR